MNKTWFFFLFFIHPGAFAQSSIYDITQTGITGATIHLNDFRGKEILIVNMASGSPLADQYNQLKQLSAMYRDSGLVVLGLPSNDFNTEAKTNEELRTLYQQDTALIISQKISVSGAGSAGLYQWLTSSSQNGVMDSEVKGDFQKYLINRQGKLVGILSGKLNPLEAPVINAIRANSR